MKRRRPPQPAHASTSIANTRRIRSAHAQARRIRLAAGAGGDVGGPGIGNSGGERSGGLQFGGGDDGSIAAVVAPGTVGNDGMREGASGADVDIGDLVDGAVAGAMPVGADDPGGRHRARGASTP